VFGVHTLFVLLQVLFLVLVELIVRKDSFEKDIDVMLRTFQRVNMQRVFPSLCKECTNNNMVPFVLPNMMLIAEKASDADFSKHIFPAFIPLFRITDPLQV